QFLVRCVGALRVSQTLSNLLAAASRPVAANTTSRCGATSQIPAGNLDASGISHGYRIAKAAQNMLTQCLAHAPSLSRISVVAVSPGRLLSGSASSDATRRPEEAAKAILDILERRKFQSGMMIHAFGEECSW